MEGPDRAVLLPHSVRRACAEPSGRARCLVLGGTSGCALAAPEPGTWGGIRSCAGKSHLGDIGSTRLVLGYQTHCRLSQQVPVGS